ncbi:MAG: DUF4249 domain-containing protein, partial [Bacteroidales bacterium]|nr:DUF4249 domain-containing protein [Bacteroidales bacterium]
LLLFLLCACQKEINVKLPDYDKKLVVEGFVVNGQHPTVILTRSIAYLSDINIDTLKNNIMVNDAVITVTSSKGETEVLQYRLSADSPIGFAYVAENMVGELGVDYDLNIEWRGKTYTSKTSVLYPFQLDSTWLAFHGDSSATIRIKLSDDPAKTDYYHFCVKVYCEKFIDKQWVTSIPVAFDDGTFNGQTFNYEIMRGNPSALFMPQMSEEEEKEYYRMTFRPGDTVVLRSSAIDYNSYRFWSSAGSDIIFGQNPFLSPAPIISNIKGNDVLGVWCGFAAQYDTLVFK